ncbi:hypothetical protein I862_05670 [endosymbiont of Acanthamoeba sp. UWC8]|uniref:hypothetical protein n=1 Tax=endosymbiont of Acanthamoeba sp. UWC8 TaxID=86106 RepID=UPI0004D1ACFC|nr:hypothetical protein [endosymbiont of Acanthamoeba sp. UWC8]AIF81688.1 hypothetical protein I862_05670 [endosymbiont of Acanthamoeba sp. UWC8]
MTKGVVKEVLDVLNSLGKLAEGAAKMDPNEVMNSTKTLVVELGDLISQSGDIRKDLKGNISSIIDEFKDNKTPVDIISDLVKLEQNFEQISGSFIVLKDALVATITKLKEAFVEIKDYLSHVGHSGKELVSTFIAEDKEFCAFVKKAINEAKNETSEHHGVKSFVKQVAVKTKEMVENKFEAVGKFVHDVVAMEDTKKLVDFAEGLLSSAQNSSDSYMAIEPAYNVSSVHSDL